MGKEKYVSKFNPDSIRETRLALPMEEHSPGQNKSNQFLSIRNDQETLQTKEGMEILTIDQRKRNV